MVETRGDTDVAYQKRDGNRNQVQNKKDNHTRQGNTGIKRWQKAKSEGRPRTERAESNSLENRRPRTGRAESGNLENRRPRTGRVESDNLENRRPRSERAERGSLENRRSRTEGLQSGKIENERSQDRRPRNGKSRGEQSTYNVKKITKEKDERVRVPKKKALGCPIYEKCGGCLGQEEPYETTLVRKQAELQTLLGEFGRLDPIIGMEKPYHYRNKVHAVFAHDKKGPYCGVYAEGTHRVVPVEKCWIENEKASQIILSVRDLLTSFKIKTYNEDKGYGLLRHVLVRTGYKTGEIMVVLVLTSTILPSKNNFVKALRKLHPEITTILINENYKNTSMVLGDKEQTIYGPGFIYDELCGKTFRISAKSFYQVNPVQTEILYKKAIDFAELTGMDTILDAYCGIGTIGMVASDYVKKVISVELNPDAVRDAVTNARKNNIKNIDFYTKDASVFMTELAEAGDQKIDVVFMDPPRSGSTEQFMDACTKLAPKKIVYISCNPHSLARDLEYVTKKGYRVKKMVGVDLFPWTKHCEVCVELCRK
ncbi:MAG: 23S rRNA (uracil(1939)-C(5))-methyltransferase RlmD [Lachnospiraceae bacterium]|nr:23S rRNA (uracil(1939)-C(5))-methyltransferase RlmD [Lachnospiraceae bacterium]